MLRLPLKIDINNDGIISRKELMKKMDLDKDSVFTNKDNDLRKKYVFEGRFELS